MQFRFRHRPLEAEQQTVVEVARMVDPVGIAKQRVEEGTKLQEPIPVGAVPREPGHLITHDNADLPQPHVGGQSLEAFAACGMVCGPTLVVIDHGDLVFRPAQLMQAILKRTLVHGTLLVFHNLPRTRLAQVDDRRALEVRWLDLA